MLSEFGLIGLGVMGKSLSRNVARKGVRLSIYNRHLEGVEENVAVTFKNSYPELESSKPFDDLMKFVESLEKPRKIMLMVNSGEAVDSVLKELQVLLQPGDIVIDGGNSHFEDTNRRVVDLSENGVLFIGAGISGGEEGALNGPSIMPSGNQVVYKGVQQYLELIAARDINGQPCCTYVGPEGSGHFVKMVHNGIEYVEMQLLAECYFILKRQGQSNEEIARVFKSWQEKSNSYLLTITIEIILKREETGYLLDSILDKAGNKGTGSWTTIHIANSGQPSTLIPAALLARYLSFYKEDRIRMSRSFPGENDTIEFTEGQLLETYQFARILNHQQGFQLIRNASEQYGWNINLSEIARIWTGGCIIKSDFMTELVAYLKPDSNLLTNEEIKQEILQYHNSAKVVASECISKEIHAPCLIESLNYFHGLKTGTSSANLIQAQRDYFGAHTYQRTDDPSGKFYHTKW